MDGGTGSEGHLKTTLPGFGIVCGETYMVENMIKRTPEGGTIKDRRPPPPSRGRIEIFEMRHDKTSKMSVRPAKTQISLGTRPV